MVTKTQTLIIQKKVWAQKSQNKSEVQWYLLTACRSVTSDAWKSHSGNIIISISNSVIIVNGMKRKEKQKPWWFF